MWLAWFDLYISTLLPTYDRIFVSTNFHILRTFTYVRYIVIPYYKYGLHYFFTNDWYSFFKLRFIFDIDRHSVKLFGEQWAGRDGVSQVSVFHLVIDNCCYLPHSIIVDDKSAVVEDGTFCHDFFYRTTCYHNAAWLIVGIDHRYWMYYWL